MKLAVLLGALIGSTQLLATPHFVPAHPIQKGNYQINGQALCATAKETLAYLNKGAAYDPDVIHGGKVIKLPLERVKATLVFICQHQNQLNSPAFIQKHFDFVRWYHDSEGTTALKHKNALLANIPKDKVLMTKYYVHQAKIANHRTADYPLALYAIPQDEAHLTLESANAKPHLTRFKYGKQAILKGALNKENVTALAYLNRDDLEAALLQGTVVAELGSNHPVIFNVHRCNNIAYDKTKNPYHQERYWYFKQVDGIKGYGKDADHKITVNPEVTFAADLKQFGLGKLLMVQYPDSKGQVITRAGILADTGGAFQNNLYQVDYLSGTYRGKDAFYKANHHLPDYVAAYFMVLKG